jgi:hypothetical protein
MLLGCAIALVGTAAAFPCLPAAELDSLVDETPDPGARQRRNRPAATGNEGSD